MPTIYITGGARSGKSAFAQDYARRQEQPVGYIATAIPFDQEMRHRIALHQQSRPEGWATYERNEGLDELVGQACEPVLLLDCVTVWLTNLMMGMDTLWEQPDQDQVERAQREALSRMDRMLDAAVRQNKTLLIVSNELGMGLVPVTCFGRVFRDIQGRLNQRLAQRADEAYLLVSGIPLRLK